MEWRTGMHGQKTVNVGDILRALQIDEKKLGLIFPEIKQKETAKLCHHQHDAGQRCSICAL